MLNEVTYYLGRVIKLGSLTSKKLINGFNDSVSIIEKNVGWAFNDIESYDKFIIGVLTKFDPKGEINVLDTTKHRSRRQIQPNLILAQSAFIYLPEFSGIAFQKISNQIEPPIFGKRFSSIVRETHKNFFMDCDVEMITDLRSFTLKLEKLEFIDKIYAKVNPPNPLFSPLWEPLKNYLKKREVEKLRVEETAKKEHALDTKLIQYIRVVLENKIQENEPYTEIPLADAAILMAADGYGQGLVHGKQRGKYVTIKTSETIRNFSFDKIPEPQKLYELVYSILQNISEERHMRHE